MSSWDPTTLEQVSASLFAGIAELQRLLDGEDDAPLPPIEGRLAALAEACELTSFETHIVLLAAASRLDGAVAEQCRARGGLTFGLALQLFDASHLSALHPDRPLRRLGLVEFGDAPVLHDTPLRLPDRMLHELLGLTGLDEVLRTVLEPIPSPPIVVPSFAIRAFDVANALLEAWRSAQIDTVWLSGRRAEARAFASLVAESLNLNLYRLDPSVAAYSATDRQQLHMRWARELVLGRGALWLEEGAAAGRGFDGLRFAFERTARLDDPEHAMRVQVPDIDVHELVELWVEGLGEPERERDRLASHLLDIRLSLAGWHLAMVQTRQRMQDAPHTDFVQAALEACFAQQDARLASLAQPLAARATWEDLVLPDIALAMLKDIVRQVHHRHQVLHGWGFARTSSRGLGLSVLFHGPPGTGKTLAAEVIANALGRALYRVDLSQVVSKYIGETEKNLKQVFEAADGTGAVLLFDEADALFGKRSEVRDSHDRYANLEVSFLLQEMEQYRGLAVLTTNRKDAMDPAFQRRLRFIVGFPRPDERARRALWARAFPPDVPLEPLDLARLAAHPLTGADIRNAAMAAAYAGVARGAVGPEEVEQAVKAELLKTGQR